MVTHGHADHARPGNHAVLATPETIAIAQSRYGSNAGRSLQPLTYGESLKIGDVTIRFLPAGHILGSAQILMEYRGQRIIVSRGITSATPTSDMHAIRGDCLRYLYNGGDIWPAGLPPSTGR